MMETMSDTSITVTGDGKYEGAERLADPVGDDLGAITAANTVAPSTSAAAPASTPLTSMNAAATRSAQASAGQAQAHQGTRFAGVAAMREPKPRKR
jgi:hypothetical protein